MRIPRLESRPIRCAPPDPAQTRPGVLPARAGAWRRAALLAVLVATLTLAFATPSYATNAGEQVIQRCTHDESLSGFSQGAYRQALKELEADLEEYSPNCASEIGEAERAAAGGSRGDAGSAAQSTAAPVAVTATPSQQRSIAKATSSTPGAVKLGGGVVHPGVVHVDVASALSSLPTPLLAILAFLLACLLAVAGGALRKRVRAGRPD